MATGMFKKMTMAILGGVGLLFLAQCSLPVQDLKEFEITQQIPGVWTAGDSVLVGAYCVGVDDKFMKAFTALVAEGGDPAYREFMHQMEIPCYDIRMHRMNPVKGTLIKRLWEFELPSGQRFSMWTVKSADSVMAYTWIPIRGQET